jgi:hypothetical protein
MNFKGFAIISSIANFTDVAIKSSDITDLFSWTTGAAIDTNKGETYTTSLFKYSNYVDISEIPKFEMSFVKWRSVAGQQPTLGYALYDANKNFISSVRYELADASVGNSAGIPCTVVVDITNPLVKYIRTGYPVDEAKYGVFKATILD